MGQKVTEKRRKRSLKKSFIVIFLGLLLVVLFITAFVRGAFTIDHIEVAPDDYREKVMSVTDTWLAQKLLWYIPRNTVLTLPSGKIKEEITTTYNEVEKVTISRKGLHGLEITLTIREPLFRLHDNLAIDTSGVVYMEPKDISILPVLMFDGISPGKELLSKMHWFVEQTRVALGEVTSVEHKDTGDVYFYLQTKNTDTPYIVLKDTFDMERAWSIMLSAFDTNPLKKNLETKRDLLEYIDLRFGNKVFYKFDQEAIHTTASTTTHATSSATTTHIQ
jgi:hypothetical protein